MAFVAVIFDLTELTDGFDHIGNIPVGRGFNLLVSDGRVFKRVVEQRSGNHIGIHAKTRDVVRYGHAVAAKVWLAISSFLSFVCLFGECIGGSDKLSFIGIQRFAAQFVDRCEVG